MRGKRAKKYRQLMNQYHLSFNFREPYQVLLSDSLILDAHRCKMELVTYLERTVSGRVKPLISQCCMRHLYATKDSAVIESAKAYERRRCGHHELEKPLSTLQCMESCVDPKGSEINKNRYVVAAQEEEVRDRMRKIPGVPLIYIKRSVMVMEPMAWATQQVREKDERGKFRLGIRGKAKPLKRKREDEENGDSDHSTEHGERPNIFGGETPLDQSVAALDEPVKKKKRKGPKGPNPLSVKKSKKRDADGAHGHGAALKKDRKENDADAHAPSRPSTANGAVSEEAPKKKRKRKHKPAESSVGPAIDLMDT